MNARIVTVWATCTAGRLDAILHDTPGLERYYGTVGGGIDAQLAIDVADIPALEAELKPRGIELGLI